MISFLVFDCKSNAAGETLVIAGFPTKVKNANSFKKTYDDYKQWKTFLDKSRKNYNDEDKSKVEVS
jgi:hypothetical protein